MRSCGREQDEGLWEGLQRQREPTDQTQCYLRITYAVKDVLTDFPIQIDRDCEPGGIEICTESLYPCFCFSSPLLYIVFVAAIDERNG